MRVIKKVTRHLPYNLLSPLRDNLVGIGAIVDVKHGIMSVGVVTPEMYRKASALLR